jgi:L-gulonolactone oxidase
MRAKSRFSTWSGEYQCNPKRVFSPRNLEEVQQALRCVTDEKLTMRPFGALHSSTDIAISDHALLTLEHMDRVLECDASAGTIRLQGGIRQSQLNEELAARGLAMPVLGAISDQTVAGAISTATHGTGLSFGVISALVTEIELVTPSGDVIQVSRRKEPELLEAARCSLGALGVITELTLQVCPAFDLELDQGPSDLEQVLQNLPQRLKADHYQFWILPHTAQAWEWTATRVSPRSDNPSIRAPWKKWLRDRLMDYYVLEAALFCGTHARWSIPSINGFYSRMMLSQRRHSSGRSDRLFNSECLIRRRVSEWAIPIEHSAKAIRQLVDMIDARGFKVHLPIEVRFVHGDEIWLSPCYGGDRCYVSTIEYLPYRRTDSSAMDAYFQAFEQIMLEFDGRPHWAKRFGPTAERLRPMYPQWEAFNRVQTLLDPKGHLRNPYLDRVFGVSP